MSYELEFRLALRQFEYVNVRIESETMTTLSIDLDSLKISVPTPIDGPIQRGDYEAIDLKAFAIDDED